MSNFPLLVLCKNNNMVGLSAVMLFLMNHDAYVAALGMKFMGSVQHYICSLVVFLHLRPPKIEAGLSEPLSFSS